MRVLCIGANVDFLSYRSISTELIFKAALAKETWPNLGVLKAGGTTDKTCRSSGRRKLVGQAWIGDLFSNLRKAPRVHPQLRTLVNRNSVLWKRTTGIGWTRWVHHRSLLPAQRLMVVVYSGRLVSVDFVFDILRSSTFGLGPELPAGVQRRTSHNVG